MPNPIIGVFSDIPQSSETSAGSSAAQNTQRYKEIEQIAKYNRENNTNFYTLAQIQEHQKKLQELERAKTVASNPDPEDVRDAYISALNPQTTEDVDKIRKWDKDAATTSTMGTVIGTLPFWGPTAAHVLSVLANPATASTTFGSLAATGADIAGMYAGAKGLFSDANKITSGNYSWKDVPMTGLNLIGFTPGASVLTRAGNWRTAINTGANAYNTAKGWAPIFTNKQYWQALPGNTRSLITTLTPSGKRILQSIADDTYTAMANRVEGIAKNSKFPNIKDVGIEAGFPEKSLITARGDFGNPTIRADVTNPDLMELFGAKPLNTKVNYTFSLDPNSVQMAGFRGADGIQINRAHFLFPFKSSSGEWKMLNVNGMNGNPYTLVGHEAGHAAMAQINPLKGIKPFKLNGTNFTINKENELFHSGKDFSSLLSKAGTHDGLPEEYLADYFGELASRGLPQNTDWNLIPEATRTSIINSISNRRSMPQSQVQQLLDGLSDYGYIGTKPIETPQLTGHFGQVKYYGPTMGKTTAAKSNPKLVDFDDIIRQPSRSILDRFGFKNKAEMYNSGNQEAIKAYEDMLVKSLRDWRANPENSNLTLVASPTAIANPIKTGFYFDNIPSIPSRSVFIARNVGRGGTPEASAMWYDSLMEKNPNLKIDNRFVSEIEKQAYITPNTGYKSILMEEPIMGRGRPKKSSTEVPISPEAWDETLFEDLIGEQGAINAARKASQAGKRVLKPITEAEKLGIPKSLRSDSRALEDPYYWGYEQWNQRYNDAVNSGNVGEAQRLRDLHFKIKTSLEPKHYYHGTNTRFTQFDENYIGTLDPGWYGRGFYFTPDKGMAEGYASVQTGPNVIYDSFLNVKNPIYRDAGIWDDTIVGTKIPETNDGVFVRLGEPEIVLDKSLQYDPNEIVEVVVPKANQIKLADPITRTNNGKIIPIVKRDNFHNPDIRYKQGGTIKSIFKAQNGTFKDFWDSLPTNQKDSTDFNVRRYWELWGKPKTFNEALEKGAYKLESDGVYHAFSGAWNKNGEYEFTKSPQHPTIKNELDWFNSDDAKDFRSKYQLDSTRVPWKYKPINPQQ